MRKYTQICANMRKCAQKIFCVQKNLFLCAKKSSCEKKKYLLCAKNLFVRKKAFLCAKNFIAKKATVYVCGRKKKNLALLKNDKSNNIYSFCGDLLVKKNLMPLMSHR